MKYCGVATPFRGVRVYTRSAMGMPGSETALEELMCRVLGDLLQDGVVATIGNDLYCGGDTPEQLLANWHHVLEARYKCYLKLSSNKTVIVPNELFATTRDRIVVPCQVLDGLLTALHLKFAHPSKS